MRLAALVLLGVLTLPPSLGAQELQEHRGVWGGFGLGGGFNGDEGNTWGFSGYGRIGGTTSQRVLLGMESSGWIGSRGVVDLYRSNFSGIILFYPASRGGLFFKGGAGFSYITSSISEYVNIGGVDYFSGISQSETGFAATVGVGFDVRLGRNIYLVPEVDWYFQSVGEPSVNFGVPGTINIFAFSVGLVWH